MTSRWREYLGEAINQSIEIPSRFHRDLLCSLMVSDRSKCGEDTFPQPFPPQFVISVAEVRLMHSTIQLRSPSHRVNRHDTYATKGVSTEQSCGIIASKVLVVPAMLRIAAACLAFSRQDNIRMDHVEKCQSSHH